MSHEESAGQKLTLCLRGHLLLVKCFYTFIVHTYYKVEYTCRNRGCYHFGFHGHVGSIVSEIGELNFSLFH